MTNLSFHHNLRGKSHRKSCLVLLLLVIHFYLFAYLFGTFFFFCPYYVALHNLSSLTRDWTWVTAVKAPSPNHWTSRDFLLSTFLTVKALMRIISYCCSGKMLHYSLCFFIPSGVWQEGAFRVYSAACEIGWGMGPLLNICESVYPSCVHWNWGADRLPISGTLVGDCHGLCLCETSSG